MKKTHIFMNKPVYLGLGILEISETILNVCWHDYMEPKYKKQARLCYMDTNSYIICVKTKYIYVNISNDVETRFDTSNYELGRPLSTETIKI